MQSDGMVCVIMQPTYLPWAGYFNLINAANVFIFLDDVQFGKQSWQHRNRVLVAGKPHWLTVPVHRERLSQRIYQIKIADNIPWRKKHIRLLEQTYSKHLHFDEIREVLSIIGNTMFDSIAELNIRIILLLCKQLGLEVDFYKASELRIPGQRSERLLSICKYFGCTKYLSPAGSAKYLEQDGMFHAAAVNLRYQTYTPGEYPQKGAQDFVANLSVLDVIANIGCEETRQYIRTTYEPMEPA